jgi:hypothetical protein
MAEPPPSDPGGLEGGSEAGDMGKPECLADQLWFPFYMLIAKPKATAIAVAVSNGVFIFFWSVPSLLSLCTSLSHPSLCTQDYPRFHLEHHL